MLCAIVFLAFYFKCYPKDFVLNSFTFYIIVRINDLKPWDANSPYCCPGLFFLWKNWPSNWVSRWFLKCTLSARNKSFFNFTKLKIYYSMYFFFKMKKKKNIFMDVNIKKKYIGINIIPYFKFITCCRI